jgi:hypothetical protein
MHGVERRQRAETVDADDVDARLRLAAEPRDPDSIPRDLLAASGLALDDDHGLTAAGQRDCD